MRFIIVGVAVVCAGCGVRKTDLDETLEWMDNTYNPHEKVSGARGHGRSAWYAPGPNNTESMASGRSETFTYKGCEMTLSTEDLPESPKSQEIQTSLKMTFNLRDIDPASLKITRYSHSGGFGCSPDADGEKSIMADNCDHAEMTFSTRNAAGLIKEDWISVYQKLAGSDHINRNTEKSNSSYFAFDDPEYAQRFSKAFSHAIALCGGRPSKF